MKNIFKYFVFFALAALTLFSCKTKELVPEVQPDKTLKTITFTTAICDETKVTLETSDDADFYADWQDGDKVAVAMFIDGEYYDSEADFNATWSAADETFSAEVDTDIHDDDYQYRAIYPVGEDGETIEFGSVRHQSGNDYNGDYDVMLSEDITTNLSELSENDKIIFPMHRQTAIAYFHLTSDIDEPLVSAELEMTGGNIAGDIMYGDGVLVTDGTSNKINITFGNEAPNAKDFKLWYNLLPVEKWEKLQLTVKTTTKVKVISNTKGGEYKRGRLYKVAPTAKVVGWADRDDLLPFNETFDKITSGNSTSGTGSSTLVKASEIFRFDSDFASVFKAGNAIRLGKSGRLVTKPLVLDEAFTVWAKIKGWSDKEKTLTVTFGDESKTMIADNYMGNGDFAWASVDFEGDASNSQVSFTTDDNTRVFIDRIYICPQGQSAPLEHNLEVSTDVITLGHILGDFDEFTVTSNYAWKATVKGSGFEITPSTGQYGETIVKVTATADSDGFKTLGTISITDDVLTKEITIKQEAAPDDLTTDNLTAELLGLKSGSSYGTVTDKRGNKSNAVYSANAVKGLSYIQIRNQSPSGIVSTQSGGTVRKVKITWAEKTVTGTGRTVTVYGKDEAYSLDDLYTDGKKGKLLGTITKGDAKSETIEISEAYEFVGLVSNNVVYMDQVDISWGEPKADRNLAFYLNDSKVENIPATVGETFTEPTLKDGETEITEVVTYSSDNEEVASVDSKTGTVTIKKKGTATITATVPADETHRTATATYTIEVNNVLDRIEIDPKSKHTKVFQVGDDFSFKGIQVWATYNDGSRIDISDKLTESNFSGTEFTEEEKEHTITVSYTETGVTKTTTYIVEIQAAVHRHEIILPEAENGNSVICLSGAAFVDGKYVAAEGADVILQVKFAQGYHLTSLKVNNDEQKDNLDSNSHINFTMPPADAFITASFSNLYTITFEPNPANGTVKVNNDSSGSVTIAAGTTVTLEGVADDKYVFKNWTLNPAQTFTSGSATSTSATFIMPAQTVNVSGEFEVKTATITINKDKLTNPNSNNNMTYGTYNWTDGEVSGVYNGASASNATSFQFNYSASSPNNYRDKQALYNTVIVPGYIQSISMNHASGTDRKWTAYVSENYITPDNYTEAISLGEKTVTTSGVTFNVISGNYSFFYLRYAVGSPSYVGDVVITYIPATVTPPTPTIVPVTGVELNKTSLNLVVNTTADLEATVKPDNATNKNVSWSSSNTDVATVYGNGRVYAAGVGTATIIATSDADPTKSDSCTVTVTESGGEPQTLEYSFTIDTSNFKQLSSGSGYITYNGEHNFTAKCTSEPTKTMAVTVYSNQIMIYSSKIQGKKNEGYLYNTTDLGKITSVTVEENSGYSTIVGGTTQNPDAGGDGGYFKIAAGGITSSCKSIEIKFEK